MGKKWEGGISDVRDSKLWTRARRVGEWVGRLKAMIAIAILVFMVILGNRIIDLYQFVFLLQSLLFNFYLLSLT